MKDQQVVQRTKSKGLLFCTYGAENENDDSVRLQKKLGVDAFILDNIVHMNKKLQRKEQLSNFVIADNLLRMSFSETAH